MYSRKYHQTTEKVISQETEVSHLSFVGHGDRTGVVLQCDFGVVRTSYIVGFLENIVDTRALVDVIPLPMRNDVSEGVDLLVVLSCIRSSGDEGSWCGITQTRGTK